MKDSNDKSLKVINESIFDKIKRFILKIFRKEQMQTNNEIQTKDNAWESKAHQQGQEETQKTNEVITKLTLEPQTEEEAQKNLIKRIESKEIKPEEPKDEELEKIKEDLSRYLGKIQKEIEKNVTKESI